MLQRGHSALLSTFIKLPFTSKTFVLSIFQWPIKTGFTVQPANAEQLKYSTWRHVYHVYFDYIKDGQRYFK